MSEKLFNTVSERKNLQDKSSGNDLKVVAHMDGRLLTIDEVPDYVFSQRIVGDGFAIDPINGDVVSPVDGIITTILSSKHALGITTKNGLEVLVHFGLDTVELNGEGIETLVTQGEEVSLGQPIIKAHIEKIRDKVTSLISPVVFTNLEEGKRIVLENNENVKKGEKLNIIIK